MSDIVAWSWSSSSLRVRACVRACVCSKYNANPKLRLQKIDCVSVLMDFMQRELGLNMIGCTPYGQCGRRRRCCLLVAHARACLFVCRRDLLCRALAADIVDGSLKRILGLVSMIYQHYKHGPDAVVVENSAGSGGGGGGGGGGSGGSVVSRMSAQFVAGYQRRAERQRNAALGGTDVADRVSTLNASSLTVITPVVISVRLSAAEARNAAASSSVEKDAAAAPPSTTTTTAMTAMTNDTSADDAAKANGVDGTANDNGNDDDDDNAAIAPTTTVYPSAVPAASTRSLRSWKVNGCCYVFFINIDFF